jgi:hypothetical protein
LWYTPKVAISIGERNMKTMINQDSFGQPMFKQIHPLIPIDPVKPWFYSADVFPHTSH